MVLTCRLDAAISHGRFTKDAEKRTLKNDKSKRHSSTKSAKLSFGKHPSRRLQGSSSGSNGSAGRAPRRLQGSNASGSSTTATTSTQTVKKSSNFGSLIMWVVVIIILYSLFGPIIGGLATVAMFFNRKLTQKPQGALTSRKPSKSGKQIGRKAVLNLPHNRNFPGFVRRLKDDIFGILSRHYPADGPKPTVRQSLQTLIPYLRNKFYFKPDDFHTIQYSAENLMRFLKKNPKLINQIAA